MQITLDTFGIAGSFQPGGCVPVRISLRSEIPDTTSVLISFEVPNSDGDIERYTRPVVVAPGQSISRWLYPNLPPMASADVMRSMIFTVRVHEDDGGQAGREIASTQVSASTANVTGTPVEMKEQMILVVGNGQLGLRAYQQTITQTNSHLRRSTTPMLRSTLPTILRRHDTRGTRRKPILKFSGI